MENKFELLPGEAICPNCEHIYHIATGCCTVSPVGGCAIDTMIGILAAQGNTLDQIYSIFEFIEVRRGYDSNRAGVVQTLSLLDKGISIAWSCMDEATKEHWRDHTFEQLIRTMVGVIDPSFVKELANYGTWAGLLQIELENEEFDLIDDLKYGGFKRRVRL